MEGSISIQAVFHITETGKTKSEKEKKKQKLKQKQLSSKISVLFWAVVIFSVLDASMFSGLDKFCVQCRLGAFRRTKPDVRPIFQVQTFYLKKKKKNIRSKTFHSNRKNNESWHEFQILSWTPAYLTFIMFTSLKTSKLIYLLAICETFNKLPTLE